MQRAGLVAGLLAAVLAAGGAAAAQAAAPSIRAPAAILVDARTGTVLFAKHARRRRPIASTTKLMTALLALRSTRPTQTLSAVPYPAQAAESTLGLRAGERMSMHDLMRALLLASANDAAATIAEDVAGSRAAFVSRMNAEARRIGLTHTSYANPIGLDDRDNYSSARDLATLARRLMGDPLFAAIVDLPQARLRTGSHQRTVVNRNQLVRSVPFVDGVKTGHTERAGYVLVGAAHRASMKVISVVLGEPSEAARNSESLALLRYGVSQFKSEQPVSSAKTIGTVSVQYFDGSRIGLHAARDVRVTLRRGASVRTDVRLPPTMQITGPLPAGAKVGAVTVYVDGRRVGRVPVVTSRAAQGAGFWRRTAIRIARTEPTVALGIIGVVLLAALQLRGPLLRRARGRVGRR